MRNAVECNPVLCIYLRTSPFINVSPPVLSIILPPPITSGCSPSCHAASSIVSSLLRSIMKASFRTKTFCSSVRNDVMMIAWSFLVGKRMPKEYVCEGPRERRAAAGYLPDATHAYRSQSMKNSAQEGPGERRERSTSTDFWCRKRRVTNTPSHATLCPPC